MEPSGRPHTARNCCSNWLVTQASKVKWPELCGRGASSLTISLPSSGQEQLDREQADDVESLGDAAARARRPRRRDVRLDRRPGLIGEVEDVAAVRVLDHGQSRRSRRPPAGRDRPTPRLEGTNASRIHCRARLTRRTTSSPSAGRSAYLALAVVAEVGGLQHRGGAQRHAAAAWRSATPAPAERGDGEAVLCEERFSRRRCRQMWSTWPAGMDGRRSAIAAAVSAGMFSNSKVTTSTLERRRGPRRGRRRRR